MNERSDPGVEQNQQDDAAREYISTRAKAGASRKAIVEELIQRGYDPITAGNMVRESTRKHALSTRTSGLVYLIGGLAITALAVAATVGSYSSAAEQGGTYVICWGAAIFGLILAVRGIRQLLSGREVK